MTPPLTVLIPTHGRPDLLGRTLESVAECELPESYEELVVIENGSRAGAERIVEQLPKRLNARYMHRERANKSYALNEALGTITDGLVVFFDDDVRVHADTLVAYSEAAHEHGSGHFFGGTVEVDREQEPPEWLEPSLPDSAKGYVADGSRTEAYYLGYNWAAYSKDIRTLGGFDPRFGPGAPTGATGQETNMQERLEAAEISPIDVRQASVTHYVPRERCTFRWALSRWHKAGIMGFYKSGRDPRRLFPALQSIVMGALLVMKSLVVWKPASVAFGLVQISGGVGVFYATLQFFLDVLVQKWGKK